MRFACLLSRRRLLPYLEGELGPRAAARLERHLAGCGRCAEFFSRLRAGHEAGLAFGRLGPAVPRRLPSFEAVRAGARVSRAPSSAYVLPAALTAAVALAAIFIVNGRDPLPRDRDGANAPFTQMSIREFAPRSRSRVVTEGFVQNVYYDEQERSLHIKLAEGPGGPGPFVICEVRDARGLTIPAAGSRIRVYGTARYDGQPGRGWNEVNPVLQIAVLNR